MINYTQAKRNLKCDWCGRKIKKGEYYYQDAPDSTLDRQDYQIICQKCGNEQDEIEKEAMFGMWRKKNDT